MVYAPEAGRPMTLGLLPDASGGGDGSRSPQRDLKKLALVIGLGTLSWVATYVGMLELIQANMGDLPLLHKVVVGFSVAMLMTMIIWLLDQIFSPIGPATRLCYIAGYLFLSVISVGFGFGFFWKVLESRSESSRSAETAVTAVQSALNGASTRLEQLNATLVQLAALSREKAEIERTKGTSCPNSRPGDGPRRKMRDDDAQRFTFASELVAGRVAAVKFGMAGLDGDLARIAGRDPTIIDPKTGTRNAFMTALGRKLDMTVSSYNALRTDPQMKQLRLDLSERANKTSFGDPRSGGFSCPDPQLAQALRGAARAIAELPALDTPAIAAVEGPEATIEAFRRLTTTFYGLLALKLPPSADELRTLQKEAMQSIEEGAAASVASEGGGLSQRDYIPLAVAIFVDLCLLLVAMGRPGHRLHGLMPKMRDAEQGPVIEILSRFNEIHRDAGVRESFELFRHVVFDLHGAYYVAVPLDAPPHASLETRETLRVEAQLLANLFTSFEKDRIFRRTWTPFTAAVQKKLARQGSKFAGSEAFRVYKFRDGAWSEIILGAVMGAARRAEAEAHRQRLERDLLRPVEPSLGPLQGRSLGPTAVSAHPAKSRRTPRCAAPRSVAPPVRVSEPQAPAWPRADMPQTRSRSGSAAPSRPGSAGLPRSASAASDNFGPYARSAEAELRSAPETVEPEQARPTDTAAHQTAAPDVPHPRVDLILERETATVSLPLDASRETDGLIGRLGQALTDSAPSSKNKSQRSDADEHKSPRNSVANTPPKLLQSFEEVGDDASSDTSTDDAATMASRLRPAFEST